MMPEQTRQGPRLHLPVAATAAFAAAAQSFRTALAAIEPLTEGPTKFHAMRITHYLRVRIDECNRFAAGIDRTR